MLPIAIPQWVWFALLIYVALGFLVVQSPHAEANRLMIYLGDLFKVVGLLIIIDRLDRIAHALSLLVTILSVNL